MSFMLVSVLADDPPLLQWADLAERLDRLHGPETATHDAREDVTLITG
jgi:hypothetical protein